MYSDLSLYHYVLCIIIHVIIMFNVCLLSMHVLVHVFLELITTVSKGLIFGGQCGEAGMINTGYVLDLFSSFSSFSSFSFSSSSFSSVLLQQKRCIVEMKKRTDPKNPLLERGRGSKVLLYIYIFFCS